VVVGTEFIKNNSLGGRVVGEIMSYYVSQLLTS